LAKNRPKDGMDFAEKLLSGTYAIDEQEMAKASLRQGLQRQVTNTAMKLKRTVTKEYTHDAMIEELRPQIEFLSDIFRNCGGDLDMLAFSCGASEELLRACPPQDAEDFAVKMLAGIYTAEIGELAKSELRGQLPKQLGRQRSQLKRTATKVGTGELNSEDIQAIAGIYFQNRGDLNLLSRTFLIPLPALELHAPRDGEDFARKLLSGFYSNFLD